MIEDYRTLLSQVPSAPAPPPPPPAEEPAAKIKKQLKDAVPALLREGIGLIVHPDTVFNPDLIITQANLYVAYQMGYMNNSLLSRQVKDAMNTATTLIKEELRRHRNDLTTPPQSTPAAPPDFVALTNAIQRLRR